MESLRARAARAELRQSEIASRHAQQLQQRPLSKQDAAEREIAGVYFLSRHGPNFSTLRSSCRVTVTISVITLD